MSIDLLVLLKEIALESKRKYPDIQKACNSILTSSKQNINNNIITQILGKISLSKHKKLSLLGISLVESMVLSGRYISFDSARQLFDSIVTQLTHQDSELLPKFIQCLSKFVSKYWLDMPTFVRLFAYFIPQTKACNPIIASTSINCLQHMFHLYFCEIPETPQHVHNRNSVIQSLLELASSEGPSKSNIFSQLGGLMNKESSNMIFVLLLGIKDQLRKYQVQQLLELFVEIFRPSPTDTALAFRITNEYVDEPRIDAIFHCIIRASAQSITSDLVSCISRYWVGNSNFMQKLLQKKHRHLVALVCRVVSTIEEALSRITATTPLRDIQFYMFLKEVFGMINTFRVSLSKQLNLVPNYIQQKFMIGDDSKYQKQVVSQLMDELSSSFSRILALLAKWNHVLINDQRNGVEEAIDEIYEYILFCGLFGLHRHTNKFLKALIYVGLPKKEPAASLTDKNLKAIGKVMKLVESYLELLDVDGLTLIMKLVQKVEKCFTTQQKLNTLDAISNSDDLEEKTLAEFRYVKKTLKEMFVRLRDSPKRVIRNLLQALNQTGMDSLDKCSHTRCHTQPETPTSPTSSSTPKSILETLNSSGSMHSRQPSRLNPAAKKQMAAQHSFKMFAILKISQLFRELVLQTADFEKSEVNQEFMQDVINIFMVFINSRDTTISKEAAEIFTGILADFIIAPRQETPPAYRWIQQKALISRCKIVINIYRDFLQSNLSNQVLASILINGLGNSLKKSTIFADTQLDKISEILSCTLEDYKTSPTVVDSVHKVLAAIIQEGVTKESLKAVPYLTRLMKTLHLNYPQTKGYNQWKNICSLLSQLFQLSDPDCDTDDSKSQPDLNEGFRLTSLSLKRKNSEGQISIFTFDCQYTKLFAPLLDLLHLSFLRVPFETKLKYIRVLNKNFLEKLKYFPYSFIEFTIFPSVAKMLIHIVQNCLARFGHIEIETPNFCGSLEESRKRRFQNEGWREVFLRFRNLIYMPVLNILKFIHSNANTSEKHRITSIILQNLCLTIINAFLKKCYGLGALLLDLLNQCLVELQAVQSPSLRAAVPKIIANINDSLVHLLNNCDGSPDDQPLYASLAFFIEQLAPQVSLHSYRSNSAPSVWEFFDLIVYTYSMIRVKGIQDCEPLNLSDLLTSFDISTLKQYLQSTTTSHNESHYLHESLKELHRVLLHKQTLDKSILKQEPMQLLELLKEYHPELSISIGESMREHLPLVEERQRLMASLLPYLVKTPIEDFCQRQLDYICKDWVNSKQKDYLIRQIVAVLDNYTQQNSQLYDLLCVLYNLALEENLKAWAESQSEEESLNVVLQTVEILDSMTKFTYNCQGKNHMVFCYSAVVELLKMNREPVTASIYHILNRLTPYLRY